MKFRTSFVDEDWDNIKIQQIWRMHWHLSTAAKQINNAYSIQLFFWIMALALNGIRRINSVLEEFHELKVILIRDLLTIISCFTYLFLITFSCHLTSRRVSLFD